MNSSKVTCILLTILGLFCNIKCHSEYINVPLNKAMTSSPFKLHDSAVESSACTGRHTKVSYLWTQAAFGCCYLNNFLSVSHRHTLFFFNVVDLNYTLYTISAIITGLFFTLQAVIVNAGYTDERGI